VIYVGLILAVFAVFAGAMIWRMEVLRRRALPSQGLTGIVTNKRFAQESGTLGGAPLGTYPVRPLAVTSASFVLTVATAKGEHHIVVDESTFSSVEIGDEYPHPQQN